MKTIQQIKDELAQELSYEDANDLLSSSFNSDLGLKNKLMDKVAKIYATQMCERQRKLCADTVDDFGENQYVVNIVETTKLATDET